MLSLFSLVCLALLAQTINSLPTLPSSDDDAGLSADLGLDPDPFSTVGKDPGVSFPSLDAPPSDNPEALVSQQLALNVDSSASAPPPASQDHVDSGCDKTSKRKRETGGSETSCPADFTNPSAGTTLQTPKKAPEGQQNPASQGPTNATPKKPEYKGDLRLTPSEESISNPFGEKDKDPQCPGQFKYTVCGIADPRYDTWEALFSLHDADLVINSGYGYGMVVRPGWENHGGIAGWTDALEECGPDPRNIYCCNAYLPEARQAYVCDTVEEARRTEHCWQGVMGLPSQTVLKCIENL